MSISDVTTTGLQGALATITGTGFGASRGSSMLLFYPGALKAVVPILPLTWSDTVITANIPTNATITTEAYFAVQLADGSAGSRSESFAITQGAVAAITVYDTGTLVTAKPGSTGEEVEM